MAFIGNMKASLLFSLTHAQAQADTGGDIRQWKAAQ